MPTEAPTEEVIEKTIGTQAQGDGAYAVKLTNAAQLEITGFVVQCDDTGTQTENLLETDDPFAAEEVRMFYYDTSEDAEAVDSPAYTILLTLEGDVEVSLHAFPFDDLEAAEICYEDGVANLVYTSLESETEISTKDDETARAAEEAAAAEAAAEAAAAQQAVEEQTATEAAAQQEAEQQEVEESVEESIAEESVEESVVEEPVEDSVEEADPNYSCIGDEGLFY